MPSTCHVQRQRMPISKELVWVFIALVCSVACSARVYNRTEKAQRSPRLLPSNLNRPVAAYAKLLLQPYLEPHASNIVGPVLQHTLSYFSHDGFLLVR